MEAEESKNWELCRAIQLHDNTHTHTQFPTLERKEAGDYGSLGLNVVFDQLAWDLLEYGRTQASSLQLGLHRPPQEPYIYIMTTDDSDAHVDEERVRTLVWNSVSPSLENRHKIIRQHDHKNLSEAWSLQNALEIRDTIGLWDFLSCLQQYSIGLKKPSASSARTAVRQSFGTARRLLCTGVHGGGFKAAAEGEAGKVCHGLHRTPLPDR